MNKKGSVIVKAFKKIICVLSALLIILLSVVPSLAVDLSDLTYLYLDKGDVLIGDGTVSGYGYFGNHITTVNKKGYCISVTRNSTGSVANTVVIDGGENYVAIKDLNVSVRAYDFECAFSVTNGAKVDLFVTGENIIESSYARAGIEISADSEVTVSGDGKLTALSRGQAGIGGGNGASNGTLTINSGTIIAKCSDDYSAGIGGGSSGDGGNITINGGNIVAVGGQYGTGIGGGTTGCGGNITINGGTVTATGGEYAAGIGGGWYGEMGNVVINGGSVKAIAGSSAPDIGAGYGVKNNSFPVNSDGERVYPFTFSQTAPGDYSEILINGKSYSVCGNHPDDYRFCFYVPAGTNFVTVEKNGVVDSIYKYSITSTGGSSYVAVNPVQTVNGASIGNDGIIRGITCGLTNLDNYISLSEGYSLSYDNEFIGTGTTVTVMYGETPVCRYRTLLFGDVDNDGFYNSTDSTIVLCMYWGLISFDNTDPIVIEAADADRNGYISEEDVRLLDKAGVLLSSVGQGETSVSFDSADFEEYINLIDQTPKTDDDSEENEPPVIVDNKMSFFDFVVNFIKNAVKLFQYVHSFWKNYFI